MLKLSCKKASFPVFAVVMVCLLVLSFPTLANAASHTTPFKDVTTTHWGLKNITKMNIRGVVTGYTDGTFQPNRPITQVEAVLMTIRNMGINDRLATIDTDRELAVTVPKWVTDYYKAEILFAIDEGMIIPSENNFNAAAGATRAWVTQLIVRSIGKNSEASQMSLSLPPVTDADTIPTWARGYVNAAMKYKLVNGYPDNTFKPYRYVTRAEMVKLLGESEQYLDLSETYIVARVAGLSGLSLSLSINGSIETFDTGSEPWVFDETGKLAGWDSISENEPVKVVIKDDTVRFVEILAGDAVVNTVNGTVLQVLPAEKVIVVKDTTQKIHTTTLSDFTVFSSETGSISGLEDIAVGNTVTLSLDSLGDVISVVLLNSGQSASESGIIYSVNAEGKLIIIKNPSGTLNSYQYNDQLTVIIPGIRFPSAADLESGDEVKITYAGDVLTEIELVKTRQDLTVSGKVMLLSEEKRIITISMEDSSLEAFLVADDVEINISGLDYPLLTNVLINDTIILTVENGTVTSISVENRSVKDTVTGTVLAVDTDNRVITLETPEGDVEVYEVNAKAEFLINDNTTSNMSAIERNLKVEIQLINNEIIYLETRNTVEGTIAALDTDRDLISVNTTNSGTKTYLLSDDVDVDYQKVSSPDLGDLEKGDYIELRFENADSNIVENINVRTTINYRVVRIYEDPDKLKVEDEDGDNSYLYLDNSVTVSIPGINSPDVEDFTAGDLVKATYIGNRLTKVEAVPVKRGKITTINTYTKSITIQTFSGLSETYIFDNDSEIVKDDREYNLVSNLRTGDRVEIKEKTDGGRTFTVLKKLTGTYQSKNDAGTKIYVTEESPAWSSYNLNSEAYIHSGATSLTLDDLAKDNTLDLYILDYTVYELEKK